VRRHALESYGGHTRSSACVLGKVRATALEGISYIRERPLPSMAARTRRTRVTGIGGIFFKARDPKALVRWYHRHLGIHIEEAVALFTWRSGRDGRAKGHTVWSIFPADTTYFGERGASFMINYRVKDLDAVLAVLRDEGVEADRKIEESEYGRFGWITDPEGNRIELWEPPKVYRAPEKAMPME